VDSEELLLLLLLLSLPFTCTLCPPRLWGYEVQQVCAFRDITGASLTYPGLVQLDWRSAPACTMKPKLENSMPDQRFRLWCAAISHSIAEDHVSKVDTVGVQML
jgi:hypothetical protein